MPEVGDQAPLFTLAGDAGKPLALAKLKGRTVVLYFYPKDDTSGCTAEAKDFSTLAGNFAKAATTVIGISPDSAVSHAKFKAKHDLAVDLAADEDNVVAQAYGVWVEKTMYGRRYMGVERTTFLIDAKGRVAQVWRKVKVPGHAQVVLAAAQKIASGE